MPAVPPCIIEPVWEQFVALLPERDVEHPLGCHRPRVPDKVAFEKLVQVLLFGSAPTGGSPTRSGRRAPYVADATSG
jgi:hypothetical protein